MAQETVTANIQPTHLELDVLLKSMAVTTVPYTDKELAYRGHLTKRMNFAHDQREDLHTLLSLHDTRVGCRSIRLPIPDPS